MSSSGCCGLAFCAACVWVDALRWGLACASLLDWLEVAKKFGAQRVYANPHEKSEGLLVTPVSVWGWSLATLRGSGTSPTNPIALEGRLLWLKTAVPRKPWTLWAIQAPAARPLQKTATHLNARAGNEKGKWFGKASQTHLARKAPRFRGRSQQQCRDWTTSIAHKVARDCGAKMICVFLQTGISPKVERQAR